MTWSDSFVGAVLAAAMAAGVASCSFFQTSGDLYSKQSNGKAKRPADRRRQPVHEAPKSAKPSVDKPVAADGGG